MGELKPKSFRIDDQTADKFKEITANIGGNQQEALAKLIESYEFQSGKAILTEKKSDIEQFEKYVNAITRLYMGSLEDNQNTVEIVRTEFDALLKSKDQTIQDLQEKVSIQEQENETILVTMENYKTENDRLILHIKNFEKEYQEKIRNMEKMLEDKDNLNKVLTSSCNELKSKFDNMIQEHKKVLESSKELDSTKARVKELEVENGKQVLENKNSMLELRERYNEELNILKEKHLAEIDQYQQNYKLLLEQLSENGKKIIANRKQPVKKGQESQNKELK